MRAGLHRFFHGLPVMEQARDANGKAERPHRLIWRCPCSKEVGQTLIVPKFRVVASLRLQAQQLKQAR